MSWIDSIVRVSVREESTGTGFVISNDGLIATCSHVIQNEDAQRHREPQPEKVIVTFWATNEEREAKIVAWRSIDTEDIAILKVEGELPTRVRALLLGTSGTTDGHQIATFGFPENGEVTGTRGSGTVVGAGPKTASGQPLLQLESNQIKQGFSGAPVWDEERERVIGMVVMVSMQSSDGKMGWIAYAIPTETLRKVYNLPISDICPYLGLSAFTENDAKFFFGRRGIVDKLVGSLQKDSRFLAVFGPSGSGKSSIVQAGLIPRLRKGAVSGSDQWDIIITRPTDGASFSQQVANLRRHPKHVAIFIDQFEELFFLFEKETGKETYTEIITQLTDALEGSWDVTVIITIWNDFFSSFTSHPALLSWIEKVPPIYISPTLEYSEVLAMVQEPAYAVGWQFESHLTEEIVKDVLDAPKQGGGKAGSSTILPLLEFALNQLWDKCQDGILTWDEYDRLEGVTGGLKKFADDTFASFSKELQPLVRDIFIALVKYDDEYPPVRRRKKLKTLVQEEAEKGKLFPEEVYDVVSLLIRARLLSNNGQIVEIIHDTLLQRWEQLRDWIEDNKKFIVWRQNLEKLIEAWEKTNPKYVKKREKHKLLEGSNLKEAEQYLRVSKLTDNERDFIKRSQKRRDGEVWLWRVITTVLLILLLVSGIFLSAAINQARIAQSRALAAQANYYLLKGQLDLALLLSARAYQTDNNYETRDSLLNALQYSPHIRHILRDDVPFSSSDRPLVNGLVFSSNGRTLVSSRKDGSVVLWNLETMRHYSLIKPFNKDDNTLLSPNGEIVASIGTDGLWLWDTRTGIPTKLSDKLPDDPSIDSSRFGPDGVNRIFAFSSNGHMLAIRDGRGNIIIWDIVSKKRISTLFTYQSGVVNRLAFSPDGKLVALSLCLDGDEVFANGGSPFYCGPSNIVLLDVASGKRVGSPLQNHLVGVRSLAFSPDGHILASGGTDHAIVLWDVATQKPRGDPLVGHTNWVENLTFSPDGNSLVSGSDDKTVRLWDVSMLDNFDSEPILGHSFGEPLFGHQNHIFTVAFSPDGKQVASSSSDGMIIIWDVTSDTPISQNLLCVGGTGSLAFNPQRHLIAQGWAGGINLCDVNVGGSIGNLKPPYGTWSRADTGSLAFTPDGQTLASYSSDGTIFLWDMQTKKPISHFKDYPYQGYKFQNITFSPDGHILASCACGDRSTVTLWNVATGQIICQLIGDAPIDTIAFSLDGKMVASGGPSKKITLWNAVNGEHIGQLLGHTHEVSAVSFSSDGYTLASRSTDGTIILWDTRTQKPIEHISLSIDENYYTATMAFSPDGKTLAASSGQFNSEITLWDVAKNESVVHSLSSPFADIYTVAFEPNGQLLARVNMGYGGSVAILWNTNIDSWVAHACTIANRNLTLAEWNQFIKGEPYLKVCPNMP